MKKISSAPDEPFERPIVLSRGLKKLTSSLLLLGTLCREGDGDVIDSNLKIDHESARFASLMVEKLNDGENACGKPICRISTARYSHSQNYYGNRINLVHYETGNPKPCKFETQDARTGNLISESFRSKEGEYLINYGPDRKKTSYRFSANEFSLTRKGGASSRNENLKSFRGFFYQQGGETKLLHSFALEKALNPRINVEEYFSRLIAALENPERFFEAEEVLEFNDPQKTPSLLLKKIRRHYLKKTGLLGKIEAFSLRNNIEIDTELDWWGFKIPLFLVRLGAKITMNAGFSELRPIPLAKIEKFLETMEMALEKYPDEIKKKLGLKKIHLLTVTDTSYVGFAPPLLGHIFLYEQDEDEIEGTFHHELDHRLRWANFFGSETRDWGRKIYGDKYWEYYSGGGPPMDKKQCLVAENPRAGFVSGYARRNENEDQAEMAKSMFQAEMARKLEEKMRFNDVLRKKYEEKLKFYGRLSSLLDKDHFKAIMRGRKFDREYWKIKAEKATYLSSRRMAR